MSFSKPYARNRKNPVAFGWTLVHRDYTDQAGNCKRKAVWRCPEMQRTLEGEIRRCKFVCKKQRIGRHDHDFSLPAAEDPDLHKTRHSTTVDQDFSHRVTEIVGEFTGLGGISASIASSEAMRTFIVSIMNCAIAYRESYPQVHFDPDIQIPPLNRAKITESILRAGRKAYDRLEREMSRYLYVNVMIDAATVLTMRVVHTTLANPHSCLPPIPFHATKKDEKEWCIEDYVSELSCIFAELKSRGKLIPVSVCHDRLSAQSAAVVETLRQLKESEDPSDRLIIDVPCMNHMLNNAFTSSIHGPFKELIQEVIEFANRLRERAALLHIRRKCPLPPATRWLYITDTLAFIVAKKARILDFFAHEYAELHPNEDIDSQTKWEMYQSYVSIPLIFLEFYGVLMPFKLASLHFESSSRLSDVLPVIKQLQKTFARMISHGLIEIDLVLDFLHEMLSQWFARLETYLPEETWACWVLTRSGRYELRKRVKDSVLLSGPPCDYGRPEMRKNEAARIVRNECDKIIELLQKEKTKDQETFQQEHPDATCCMDSGESSDDDSDRYDADTVRIDQLAESDNLPPEQETVQQPDSVGDAFAEAMSEQMTLHRQFKRRLQGNRQKELGDLLKLDVYYRAYEKSLNVITRYCTTLDRDQTDESVMAVLDKWLYSDSLPRLELDRVGEYEMWANMSKYDDIRPLALPALRLISTATSESSVERLISIHRYLAHDRMTNLSSEVLLARLQLQTLATEQKKHENT